MPVGMELEELHVFQRQSAPIDGRHRIARQRVGIRRHRPHAPEPADGQQRRFRMKDVYFAGENLNRHHAFTHIVFEDQIDHLVFVEELHVLLDALLIQRLQDHVAGAIGRLARSHHRPFAEVARVAAKAPLLDLAVGRPIERQAHVLQFDHGIARFFGQHLGGILIDQIIAALHGVVHVPFPVVFFHVAQRCGHATLRGARVRSRRDRVC